MELANAVFATRFAGENASKSKLATALNADTAWHVLCIARRVLSELHEVLLLLFRNRPDLAPTLLREALEIELPAFNEVRIESADLTDVQPAEYRADLVVLLCDEQPVLGIVVEAQLAPEQRKRFTWPVYAVELRARHTCPCCVLVLTPNDRTARWAAQPIHLGPGGSFTPLVIGPSGVPVVTDPIVAKRTPELAVLSSIAHGQGEVQTAVNVALAAAAATLDLDEEKRALYCDMVLAALGEAARKAFEMIPESYKFQSPPFHEGLREGKLEGRLEGKLEGRLEGKLEGEANAVLMILDTRGLELSGEERERILGCQDLELLQRWVRKAVTAGAVSELFVD